MPCYASLLPLITGGGAGMCGNGRPHEARAEDAGAASNTVSLTDVRQQSPGVKSAVRPFESGSDRKHNYFAIGYVRLLHLQCERTEARMPGSRLTPMGGGGGLQQLLLRKHAYQDRVLPGRPIEGSRDGAFSWQLGEEFHSAAVPSMPSMWLLRSVHTSQRLADS